MKRLALVLLVILVLAAPSFAQWRLDIGFDAARSVGLLASSGTPTTFGDALNWPVLPIPEVSLHYKLVDAGFIRAGIGARAFVYIIESVAYPNAFVELNLDPVVIEAQFGGGAYALFGLANSTGFGNVFIPDVSAWFMLGKSLRLGGGALGFYVPDLLGNNVPFILYVGGKVALDL